MMQCAFVQECYADKLKEELSVPVYSLEQCTDTDLFYPEASDKKHNYTFVGNSSGVPQGTCNVVSGYETSYRNMGRRMGAFLGKDCPNVVGINVPNDRLPDLLQKRSCTPPLMTTGVIC